LRGAARHYDVGQIASFADVAPRLVHLLADAARDAWVWIWQPADDPVVRARTAFKRIRAGGEVPGFQWLESDLRDAIKKRRAVTETLHVLDENEEALIYLIIARLAFERLQSGQHHIARGRLSPRGRLTLSAYKHAAARLLEFDVYDRATYDEECTLLKQEIQENG
jgi:hypothetical protein